MSTVNVSRKGEAGMSLKILKLHMSDALSDGIVKQYPARFGIAATTTAR